MKEKILEWIIGLTGIFCIYIFLASRSLALMNFILSEKMDTELQEFTKYGDLYYYNCINYFKENLPKQLRRFRLSEKNSSIGNAEILTFGDSFFDISFQKTLPERLLESLHVNVYSYITQDPTQANPFCTLQDSMYSHQKIPKYLIFETVERNIPTKFDSIYDPFCGIKNIPGKLTFDKILTTYIFKSNEEGLNDLMLKRSIFTHKIYSLISTLKFDWFGYISKMTPVYSKKPKPWLFYYKQFEDKPGGYYYKYSDKEINRYCESIEQLAKNLKEKYNLNLIFMPVPNKYSIYDRFYGDQKYSDFLPRLQNGLKSRGVKYIDLYHSFTTSQDTLYFGTDTHWNNKGVDIALDLLIKEMRRDSLYLN